MALNEQMIRMRAYELWEQEGRPAGAEMRNWDMAVHQLTGPEPAQTQPASAGTVAAVEKIKRTASRKASAARAPKSGRLARAVA